MSGAIREIDANAAVGCPQHCGVRAVWSAHRDDLWPTAASRLDAQVRLSIPRLLLFWCGGCR